MTAEEPITARIRRRAESTPETDPTAEFDSDAQPKPALTFQDRLAMERQDMDDGQTPP